MQSLGNLAIIYSKCVICGKKTVANEEGLFLCSVECRLRFTDLSKEIEGRYGY